MGGRGDEVEEAGGDEVVGGRRRRGRGKVEEAAGDELGGGRGARCEEERQQRRRWSFGRGARC